MIFLTFII